MNKIQRALISVSDKTGLEKLAKALAGFEIEIISTGGTAKFLKEKGIKVTEISDFTGFPEILDGRVKTLHPRVYAGLLAVRDNEEHKNQLKKSDIPRIDMVVVNLYPFEQTLKKPGVSEAEIIENIDIGGPSMLRAGAKNHRFVTVICDPKNYEPVIKELHDNNGGISLKTKEKLAGKVFSHTFSYDCAISRYFAGKNSGEERLFPETAVLKMTRLQFLRYGENPHQKAAFYKEDGDSPFNLTNLRQLQGKELSFNNILDLDAAWNIVKDFNRQPAVVIVKHNNPCGVGTGATFKEAYQRALSCDPVSAFGGIVATNFKIDAEGAEETAKLFLELVIAPSYDAGALEKFKAKKNLRIIELALGPGCADELDYKKVSGGFLVEEKDRLLLSENFTVPTKRKPAVAEMKAMRFAWAVCKHVKSNAIVFANEHQTVGIGGGQTSRVDSCEIAVIKACKHGLSTKGTVVASDAFFPFKDGIEALAKAGATAVIQPGGSIRDEEVIKACDDAGIAMIFTGTRHFRH